ncbi:MAG TPA: cytochrome c [Gemmatimonadales bacterium]|nr:cytochrome c [Gemmatimonadales bacterium]
MRARAAVIGSLVPFVLASLPGDLAAQQPVERPAEVTKAAIEQGQALYYGRGDCSDCHGDAGAGSAEGPSLVTGAWDVGDGTYAWLVHMTRHAGWGTRGRAGEPQRMRGPTVLDSAEVRQVAAYVWSISRGKSVPAPPSP